MDQNLEGEEEDDADTSDTNFKKDPCKNLVSTSVTSTIG